MIPLKDKVAFITDANDPIGKTCARQFAKKKFRLILIGKKLNELENLTGRLNQKFHAKCVPLQLDIQHKSEII